MGSWFSESHQQQQQKNLSLYVPVKDGSAPSNIYYLGKRDHATKIYELMCIILDIQSYKITKSKLMSRALTLSIKVVPIKIKDSKQLMFIVIEGQQ